MNKVIVQFEILSSSSCWIPSIFKSKNLWATIVPAGSHSPIASAKTSPETGSASTNFCLPGTTGSKIVPRGSTKEA